MVVDRRRSVGHAVGRARPHRRSGADADRRLHARRPPPRAAARRRRPHPRAFLRVVGRARRLHAAAATPRDPRRRDPSCPRSRRDGGRSTAATTARRTPVPTAAATALDVARHPRPRRLLVRRRPRLRPRLRRLAVRRRRRSSSCSSATDCRCCCAACTCPAVVASLTAAALVWAVAWVAYPTTFAAIFPTGETWDIAWADLGLVRDQFQHAVAPVEYVGGWSLLAAIGTAFAVLTADTFAFHARARGEALVPGAVLFVFVAALGADRTASALTLALIAAGFLAAALLRMRFAQPPRTVARPTPATRWRSRCRPPSSPAPPSCSARGSSAPACPAPTPTRCSTPTTTPAASPRCSARSSTSAPGSSTGPTRELFVVRATQPAYWRVSGLPAVRRQHVGPARALARRRRRRRCPSRRPARRRTASRSRSPALRGKLVPGAAEPVRADGRGLRWNAETSTLVRVDRDLETGDRVRRSCRPMPSFTHRRAAEQRRRTTRRTRSTSSCPPTSRSRCGDTAAHRDGRRSRRCTTQMLALQDWFRSEFQYSLDVPQGHSTSAIEAFLRQRIGYCEQFAGTFAAMARSLGVPARVAVGYTPGLRAARRQPPGARQERPRLAGDLVRRPRLGAVRADARARRAGRRGVHRRGAGPGRVGTRDRPTGDGEAAAAGAEVPPPTAPVIPLDQLPQLDETVQPTGLDPAGLLDDGAGPPRQLDRRRPSSFGVLGLLLAAAGRSCALAAGPPAADVGPPDDDAVAAGARRGRGDRVPRRSDADPARAGPRRLAAPAGRGPPAEVAGRGGHGGDVRHRRRGRPPRATPRPPASPARGGGAARSSGSPPTR